MADEKQPENPSTKPAMPAQPATRSLPAMTDRALLEDLFRTSKETNDEVKIIRADQDLLMGTVDSLKVDVRDLQRWKIDTEERTSKHSGGYRQLSSNDSKQDAVIGTISADVTEVKAAQVASKVAHEALVVKVDALIDRPDTAALVLAEVRDLAKTPTAKRIMSAALPVLLLAISAIGVKLQMSVTKLEEKPAVVAPATTVYLPAPVDGGAK